MVANICFNTVPCVDIEMDTLIFIFWTWTVKYNIGWFLIVQCMVILIINGYIVPIMYIHAV